MRKHSLFVGFALTAVAAFALSAGASAAPAIAPGIELKTPFGALRAHAPASGVTARATATGVVSRNFRVLGHNDLGTRDTNGDVWVHGNFAYVGTWADPCNGLGVKIIDVRQLRSPKLVGRLAARPGTSAEDMVMRHVSTPFFTGDLLATGIQRCGDDPALDNQRFGVDFWDVTDPTRPAKLSFLGVTTGDGGVHELDLFQRGGHVYALLATPFSEWFDPHPGGEFRIVDVTNPRAPVQVGQWGAKAHGLSPGPFFGRGSFGATFDHSARASADGRKAYVSYWDLGVLTLDISDVRHPALITRTQYPRGADGDAHSVSFYQGRHRAFLLQNDEDFDPRSPASILAGPDGDGNSQDSRASVASESPSGPPLWLQPRHRVTGKVVRAANEGCSASDYPPGTTGKIAVVRTPFPFFDPQPGPDPLCPQGAQEKAAAAAGAIAVVHDFVSTATSPQFFDVASPPVDVPVLFTGHRTAQRMVAAGSATLRAQQPSWGFLRVFDARTGKQVARFDRLPNVRALRPPDGAWSIHNNEVLGDRSYASWYSNGVVALDLRPLNDDDLASPRLAGQFLPKAGRSHSSSIPGGVPIVWGVAIRASDHTIFASDMNSGLWIIRPTGPAAP